MGVGRTAAAAAASRGNCWIGVLLAHGREPQDRSGPCARARRNWASLSAISSRARPVRCMVRCLRTRTLFTATPSGRAQEMRHSQSHTILKPHIAKFLETDVATAYHKPINISSALTKASSCLQHRQYQERPRDASMTHTKRSNAVYERWPA